MIKLSNMKIGMRLATGFGVLVMAVLAITALAWWGTTSMSRLSSDAMVQAGETLKAKDVGADVDTIRANIWRIAAQKDPGQRQGHQAEIQKAREAYGKDLGQLKAAATEAETSLLNKIEESVGEARKINNRAIDLALAGKETEAILLISSPETDKVDATVDQASSDYTAFQQKQLTDLEGASKALGTRVRWLVMVCAGVALAAGIVFSLLITRSVSGPVTMSVAVLDRISQKDITQEVPEALLARKDELGDLARSMQTMTESLRALLRDIGNGVEMLSSSSTELSTVAEQMANGSQQSSERAGTVATGAEQMSANVRSVAAAMEQSATSVGTVTTASDQMTGAINEIAKNTERATAITQEAVAEARSASEKINELGTAAREIGKVTETITEISEQTNLLALNATIEAARAGDAGKGFAVVANEIKDLANQTAQATEEIRTKISGIQDSTLQSVGEIEKITKVIAEVNDIVATIASAIEEQSVTTREIAQSITQASQGIQQVNENVAQTSSVAVSIAKDIADVNRISTEVSQGSQQIKESSAGLSQLSEQLQVMVARFKV